MAYRIAAWSSLLSLLWTTDNLTSAHVDKVNPSPAVRLQSYVHSTSRRRRTHHAMTYRQHGQWRLYRTLPFANGQTPHLNKHRRIHYNDHWLYWIRQNDQQTQRSPLLQRDCVRACLGAMPGLASWPESIGWFQLDSQSWTGRRGVDGIPGKRRIIWTRWAMHAAAADWFRISIRLGGGAWPHINGPIGRDRCVIFVHRVVDSLNLVRAEVQQQLYTVNC